MRILISNSRYYYVTCNYLFPSATATAATLELKSGSEVLKTTSIHAGSISLVANTRTNVLGSIVQAPIQWSIWDGETKTEPAIDGESRYVIDEASDIAWMVDSASTLAVNKTYILTTNIDMASKSDLAPIQLPDGSTIEGGEHTIKGISSTGALFGNVSNVIVKNLTVEDIQVSATTHVGAIANTINGTCSFENVNVSNSMVKTTSGAAGGIVGYISRKSEKDRAEELNVTFTGCTINACTILGTAATGHFVGLFSGYDNNETLTFEECAYTEPALQMFSGDFVSPYREGNEAAWLAGNDYAKFNNFLGDEKYYRGTVMYGDNRFIPKWDGTTTVEPLLANKTYDGDDVVAGTNRYVVYSPFDLAYFQEKTPNTLYFMENIDMGGICADCKNSIAADDELTVCEHCKPFNSIVSLSNLYGNNHTLYNLFVQGVHECDGSDNDGRAFIRHTDAGTFENFTFDGAVIKCIDDIRYRNDVKYGGNGYAGTLTSRAAAKMTITNVHAKNGRVIGISKFGGLIGYVPGGIVAENCTVDNYVIENHKINVNNSYAITMEKELAGMKLKAECAEDFYTEGEAGGFIGFISSNATITDCHSSNITMKCYGQEDRPTKIKCYRWERKYVFFGEYEWKHTLDIDYTIAGRHINTFIGDIRTPEANTVVINGCTTSGTYAEGYDHNITKTGKGELVGCCYFVGKDIDIAGKSMHAGDYKGTVTIDGESMPFVGG